MPQQRIDILWHPYSVPLQMQRHIPPPQRRDAHSKALEVPLNLPKAHHRYCWVCYNWGRHDVLALVYPLGALLPCLHIENKTSVKNSLTYPKKYIYIKNLKNKT
jgi:hypothetical protein